MRKEQRTILIQVVLFITTFITTTISGAEFCYGRSILAVVDDSIGFNPTYSWQDFLLGMEFSVPFLLILTVHEFGHYFMAMYHKIRASLPYYIPFPPAIFFPSIGTMGAVIRIKDPVRSNREHFDIGLAGPLAGFIVAFIVIAYGYFSLPPGEYIYTFHPEYKQYGLNYADHVYTDAYMKDNKALDIQIGSTLLFKVFEFFISDKSKIPNAHELIHYPVLLAGFFALFFTSLNLLPIGQLDGGHITYGLFGWRKHKWIATVFFVAMIFYSGLGAVKPTMSQNDLAWMIPLAIGFYYVCFGALKIAQRDRIMYALVMFAIQFMLTWIFPTVEGYPGWFLFILVISRFVGVEHPPSEIEVPLDPKRIVLGWLSLLIFILCFSPAPL